MLLYSTRYLICMCNFRYIGFGWSEVYPTATLLSPGSVDWKWRCQDSVLTRISWLEVKEPWLCSHQDQLIGSEGAKTLFSPGSVDWKWRSQDPALTRISWLEVKVPRPCSHQDQLIGSEGAKTLLSPGSVDQKWRCQDPAVWNSAGCQGTAPMYSPNKLGKTDVKKKTNWGKQSH